MDQKELLARTEDRAYFMSIHRQREGRPQNWDEDWLNAEWVEGHLGRFNALETLAVRTLEKCYLPERVHVYAGSALPFTSPQREFFRQQLADALWEGSSVDYRTAVDQSRTLPGLLDAIVTQLRLKNE